MLGAGGFLGRELEKQLNAQNFHVLPLLRKSKEPLKNVAHIKAELEEFKAEIVVNCMASWGTNSTFQGRLDSNLFTPLGLLFGISAETKLWLQCNSYFNKYYEVFGEDKDEYSYFRRVFTEQAAKMSSEAKSYAVHEVILPHLVGKGQREISLLQSAFKAARTNSRLTVGSGNQIIPILSVEDAASQIASKTILLAQGTFKQSDINPVEEISVRKLLEKIESVVGEVLQVDYDSTRDRDNEFYKPIYSTVGTGEKEKILKSLDEILGEF